MPEEEVIVIDADTDDDAPGRDEWEALFAAQRLVEEDEEAVVVEVDPETGAVIPRYVARVTSRDADEVTAFGTIGEVYEDFFETAEAEAERVRLEQEALEREEQEALEEEERVRFERTVHDIKSHPVLVPVREEIVRPERRMGFLLGVLLVLLTLGLGGIYLLVTHEPEAPEPAPVETSLFEVDPSTL